MTLDEAIQHSKEVCVNSNECEKCKEEYKQLFLWLNELKDLRNNATICLQNIDIEDNKIYYMGQEQSLSDILNILSSLSNDKKLSNILYLLSDKAFRLEDCY